MTHSELVKAAERWLAKTKRMRVVLVDVRCNAVREQADAIGFAIRGYSVLVECKASLADFKVDARKSFRVDPGRGMGDHRWFMVPASLAEAVTAHGVPARWGLLAVTPGGRVLTLKRATAFPDGKGREEETCLVLSALSRATEGWGRRMFGSIAPPSVDGDPGKSTFRVIKDLRAENARLRKELRRTQESLAHEMGDELPFVGSS